MTSLQLVFNYKKNIWSAPLDYKDLSDATIVFMDNTVFGNELNKDIYAKLPKGCLVISCIPIPKIKMRRGPQLTRSYTAGTCYYVIK